MAETVCLRDEVPQAAGVAYAARAKRHRTRFQYLSPAGGVPWQNGVDDCRQRPGKSSRRGKAVSSSMQVEVDSESQGARIASQDDPAILRINDAVALVEEIMEIDESFPLALSSQEVRHREALTYVEVHSLGQYVRPVSKVVDWSNCASRMPTDGDGYVGPRPGHLSIHLTRHRVVVGTFHIIQEASRQNLAWHVIRATVEFSAAAINIINSAVFFILQFFRKSIPPFYNLRMNLIVILKSNYPLTSSSG